MKAYANSVDWVALACHDDKESTMFQVVSATDDGFSLSATDLRRVHFAHRSERYPFAQGPWSLATGEMARTSDSHGTSKPYSYPETASLLAHEGDGFELFAADARAVVMAAEGAAKAKTIPSIALLPCSKGDAPIMVNARYLADALSGAFRGTGLFAPVVYWAPSPTAPLVIEMDWSQGDVTECRRAAVMPLAQQSLGDGPRITVDLASYVDVRQPVLV